MYPYLLLAFFQTAAPQAVLLLENCSEPERIVATLTEANEVRVRSSLAGGAKTCYAVTAVVEGRPVNGYVLGDALAAVSAYERQRRVPEAPQAPPAPVDTAPASIPAPAPAPEKPHLPQFPDFSASDLKGRPVTLSALKGKVVLLCFWSPTHGASQRELLVVSRLWGQYRLQGLDAVAISLSSNLKDLRDTLEDFGFLMPIVSNTFAIGARNGVSYESLPRTYILNGQREILAAGLHDKALESAVQKLMAAGPEAGK